MKTIENKETSITENYIRYKGNPDKVLNYKDLIMVALDIVPQGGFTPSDIRDRNRIQVALDNSDKDILLEDSDYDRLVSIIANSRWTFRGGELFEFLESIK